MDVDNIPATSSALATQKASDEVSTTMLKKSLDNQTDTANGILQSIPPSSNPNIGSIINTVA